MRFIKQIKKYTSVMIERAKRHLSILEMKNDVTETLITFFNGFTEMDKSIHRLEKLSTLL